MSTQYYPVTSHPIETLLTWVKSGEIARRHLVHEAARFEGIDTTVETTTERMQEYCIALITAPVTW